MSVDANTYEEMTIHNVNAGTAEVARQLGEYLQKTWGIYKLTLTVDGPEETVELGELRKLTRCAVEELPEPERSIFQRHYFLYQKTDEIAEALQLNSATVRTKAAMTMSMKRISWPWPFFSTT